MSGFLGAFLLFIFQVIYQKVNDTQLNKNKIKNLYHILFNDLFSIIIHLYSDIENEQKVSRNLISNRIWRDLTPSMIELFPSNLVEAITYVYLSFEILNETQDPKLKDQFKPSIKYNLNGLFENMKKNEPSMIRYSEMMKELLAKFD